MSDLRIDYSGLSDLGEEGGRSGKGSADDTRRRARPVRPVAVLSALGIVALLAVLPFALLIRGGVFAYRTWGLGTWPSLLVSALASALLLGFYAWVVTHRVGGGRRARRIVSRSAMAVGLAWVGYGLVFVASENVKSTDVRAEYQRVHPLLRLAASALILVDAESVITDAGRSRADYRRMGLPPAEASLHFEQDGGWVHALDLRTAGRPEWRNRSVEIAFRAFGFHTLRHVGTADHLHLSLPPAG